MKVAKWKVLGVAGALVLGYAASSQAFQLKVDDDTFMNVNYRLKVFYQQNDNRVKSERVDRYFSTSGLLAFDGQINDLIQFYADWVDSTGSALTWDAAYVNFAFAPEFQIKLGGDTVPFARYQLAGSTTAIIPVSPGLSDPQGVLAVDNSIPGTEGLAEIHGSIADGMINYSAAIFNQKQTTFYQDVYDTVMRSGVVKDLADYFGISPNDPEYAFIPVMADNLFSNSFEGQSNKHLSYAIRLDLSPTAWGFAPSYAHSLLGKKDILNIGFGYVYMKNFLPEVAEDNVLGFEKTGPYSTKGWTFDFMFEKKVGDIVPNIQFGYISLDDTHYGINNNGDTVTMGSTARYVQGQLLYDQVVGIGKPAIAFKYDKLTDDYFEDDAELNRWGIAFNYYIEGHAAKVALGFNKYEYDGAAEDALNSIDLETSLTDYYLFVQTKF